MGDAGWDADDARFCLRLAAELSARRILAAITVPPVMRPRPGTRFPLGAGSDDEWADTLDFTFGVWRR